MKVKAEQITAILTDVDGVLTDGGIYYDNSGNEFKKFNVKDGQIIKHLKDVGIVVGVITGRDSKSVDRRIEELEIDFYRKGVDNKLLELKRFLQKYGLKTSQVAYIGDDINDLPILEHVGLSVTPSDSRYYIKNSVDYVTPSKGGEGAFRDLADYILESKKVFKNILKRV